MARNSSLWILRSTITIWLIWINLFPFMRPWIKPIGSELVLWTVDRCVYRARYLLAISFGLHAIVRNKPVITTTTWEAASFKVGNRCVQQERIGIERVRRCKSDNWPDNSHTLTCKHTSSSSGTIVSIWLIKYVLILHTLKGMRNVPQTARAQHILLAPEISSFLSN